MDSVISFFSAIQSAAKNKSSFVFCDKQWFERPDSLINFLKPFPGGVGVLESFVDYQSNSGTMAIAKFLVAAKQSLALFSL